MSVEECEEGVGVEVDEPLGVLVGGGGLEFEVVAGVGEVHGVAVELPWRSFVGGGCEAFDEVHGFESESADGVLELSWGEADGAVREGDVLTEQGGRYAADKDATERRREDIIKLQNSLWE